MERLDKKNLLAYFDTQRATQYMTLKSSCGKGSDNTDEGDSLMS